MGLWYINLPQVLDCCQQMIFSFQGNPKKIFSDLYVLMVTTKQTNKQKNFTAFLGCTRDGFGLW